MKLVRVSLLSLGAAALFAADGCSSSSSPTTPTSDASTKNDTGTTGTRDAGHDTATAKTDAGSKADTGTNGVPPASSGPATTASTPHNLAIHYLYLGDTLPTPALTPDTNMTIWETFGYNLDGLDTTSKSTNVCTPAVATATNGQQVDGVAGIDNAFGSSIVPELGSFGISSSEISTDIAEGHFTLEFDTVGLTATTPQTNTALSGQLFAGVKYNATSDAGPPLNGTSFAVSDNWPVSAAFLTNPTSATGGSTVTFPSAYVTDGVWVSGTASGPVPLNLILAGSTLTINIHSPIVTMPISVDSAGQFHVKGGIIAGAIDAQELLASIGPILSKNGLCPAQSTATDLITSSQDIILSADGKTVSNTAGTTCNAISIGLKFDADEIAQPSIAVPVPDAGASTSCPVDGGSGSGSSSGSSSSSSSGSGSGSSSGSSSSSSSSGAG
jgi:hypothetical protein